MDTPETTGPLSPLVKILHRLEDSLLVGLLLTMIGLAVYQIFLRNVLESGLTWADPLVRVLVLWIGLVGAMVASRRDNHIRIDVITRYLPDAWQRYTRLITHVFTSLVCGIMAWYSLSFVAAERADGYTAFAKVPAWVCESVIPLAFAVISLRYLLFALNGIINPRKA